MQHHDSRGLHISAASGMAAEQYRLGLDLLLSAWPGAAEAFEAALDADPAFALAHAARARLHAMRGEKDAALQRITAATELAARHASDRERSHVEVLSLVIRGKAAEASQRGLAHAELWPRDALILGLHLGAFGLFAFSGMPDHDQARVDLCERHARHFAADDWWFLGYRGWSHTENGAVAHGRELTQRSHDLRRANANAVHALAHAMYEDGSGEEALALISGWLPDYDRSGTLHGHIAWHAALVALERDDPAQALATFERDIHPQSSLALPLNVMTDTVSLLWRLRAYGHEVPAGHWAAGADYAAPLYRHAGSPFADVHMAMLDAVTGDREGVERRAAALAAMVEQGTLAAGPVVPAVCRAVLAFADEDFRTCVRLLEPLRSEVVRIGGSGAQREIIEDTLILALMRCGESEKARQLLDARLHRRPSPRDLGWRSRLSA